MPLPPVATIAACGSIITAFKSGWELSRMLKKKHGERNLTQESKSILRALEHAYTDGLMNDKSFDKWYDRFLSALAEKDSVEMRRIYKHINILRDSKDRANRNTVYDEKYYWRRRPHSTDRYTEYSCHEEHDRQPANQHLSLNTQRAQREYYYSHALSSPYKGEIEYTPLDADFHGKQQATEERRGGQGGSRTEYHPRDSSTADSRGRQRSRSLYTETDSTSRYKPRDYDGDSDMDSNAHYHRRQDYYYSKGSRKH